jgi:superfamily II DNA or RNA helicase
MARFLRSKHDRNWLKNSFGDKCAICHQTLTEKWHADHTIPWKTSKTTNKYYMQPLCETCNLKKGTKMLRRFQKDILNIGDDIVRHYLTTGKIKKKGIFEYVFPGGGKSATPLFLFDKLKRANIVDKLCWVVPRDNLRDQAEETFLAPHLKALVPHKYEIRKVQNEDNPCKGTNGYCTTYQSLMADKSGMHAAEFRSSRYMVFLDEFHHLSLNLNSSNNIEPQYSYYEATKPLYDLARVCLCGSGTPQKGENQRLAFIDYEERIIDGKPFAFPKWDIVYGYEDAFNDRAVIEVHPFLFPVKDLEYLRNEELIQKDSIENKTDLFAALKGGTFAEDLLLRGMKHWSGYRERTRNPRSKVLVVCFNQKEAKKHYDKLKSLGYSVGLAISEEKDAKEQIRLYRKYREPDVLVTCQMAYEGLDVLPITHIICLTHIRSVPWLIQMFARALRFDSENKLFSWEKQTAFVFAPDDEYMKTALKEVGVTEFPIDVLQEELTMALSGLTPPNGAEQPANTVIPIDAKLGAGTLNHEDIVLQEDDIEACRLWQNRWGMAGSEIHTYKYLLETGNLHQLQAFKSINPSTLQADQPTILKTVTQRETDIKADITRIVNSADRAFGYESKTGWNYILKSHFKKGRPEMNEQELIQARTWLINSIKREAAIKKLNYSIAGIAVSSQETKDFLDDLDLDDVLGEN